MREKLSTVGISVLDIELEQHSVVERDGFVALISHQNSQIGAAGRMTERGLAPLVWRNSRAFFVAQGLEQAATAEEVEQLRRFQADLGTALN